MGIPVPVTYLKAKDAVRQETESRAEGFGAGFQCRTAGCSKRAVSGNKRRTEDYLVRGAAELADTVETGREEHGWESTVDSCRGR